MLNILYCLDENYNVQASNSIYSILENTKDKINVYIIHKNPESFQKFSKLILSKKNNVNFHIKRFDTVQNIFEMEKKKISKKQLKI